MDPGPTVTSHVAPVSHFTSAWSPSLRVQVLPPRQIALARLPRMQLDFEFEQIDAGARSAFMRYFDLFLQRGGG